MSLHPLYARPRNLEQAIELLSGLNAGAVIIAGGQELMPTINSGVMMPDVLVDIGGIEALRGISSDAGEIAIGALTVHRDVQDSELLQEQLPLLAYAAGLVGGGWQVHNRGTIGGNIVSMHPLYDIAPSLLALEADVELINEQGLQRQSFAALLSDTNHGLGSNAILTRVLIQPTADDQRCGYYKLKNSTGAYGSANAAAVLRVENDTIKGIRVVIGAAGEQLTLVSEALDFCLGSNTRSDWISEYGVRVEQACAGVVGIPLSDHQGDGRWRRAMAGVVACRAIEKALGAQHNLDINH
tara:strand:+ start:53260 stop:54153 length:894 start_codon:yes stop_codon:yes gene_type:complete